jgi:hypothetical protein
MFGPQISMSKEHVYESKVDLSMGQVVSGRWGHLPPITANDLFSRLLKAIITRKRIELFVDFSSKTAKISIKT